MNPLYVKVSFSKLLFRMVIGLSIFLRTDILSHYWCSEILKCKTSLGSFILFSLIDFGFQTSYLELKEVTF